MDVCRSLAREPIDVLKAWLDAGIRLVQLRAKRLAFGPLLQLAERMTPLCRDAGATFIVNDRADVAALAGAAGVHLGQDDLSPEDARAMLAEGAWIGLSTHNDDQVRAGLATVATYLAAGPVFETGTKDGADPVIGLTGIERAAAAVRSAGKPLVAIGGITLATAPAVIAAGADSVAVISDLLAGGDPASRAMSFVRALDGP